MTTYLRSEIEEDKMKQLPPKLEFRPHLNTSVLARDYDMALMTKYVNELRDYLSDKEASKGELEHPKCATCKYFGDNCGNHSNPPQQEESRGEINMKNCKKCYEENNHYQCRHDTPEVVCKSCGAEMIETEHYIGSKKLRSDFNCSKCGLSDLDKPKPQLKEESPKEDEWIDDLYENFSSHWDKNGRSLETFIKANFVSKVKIKNQLSQVEKLFKSVGLVSSLTVRNIIKEVIKGLEELC